jgi:hypothetical protein
MKKIILIAMLFLTFINCSDNSNNNKTTAFNVSSIKGKWQYVEELDYNPPGPYLITDGPTIELYSNGTFISNEIANYPNGTFTVSTDSVITLSYQSNVDTYIKLKKITSISNTGLILDNDYSGSGACTEGCAERYEKITTP